MATGGLVVDSLAVDTIGQNALGSINDLLSIFVNTPASAYLHKAARIMFWVAIAFGCLLVLHVLLVVAFRCFHRHPPSLLEFPRLELLLLLTMMQPIGQAAAQLIASGRTLAVIGGWIIFASVIVGFLTAGAWVIYSSVHHSGRRKARWVLSAAHHSKTNPSWLDRAFEACVARPLAGRPYPEGQCVHVAQHRHLRFLERQGILFEDNKGPPYKFIAGGGIEAGVKPLGSGPTAAFAIQGSMTALAAVAAAAALASGCAGSMQSQKQQDQDLCSMPAGEREEWRQHFAAQGKSMPAGLQKPDDAGAAPMPSSLRQASGSSSSSNSISRNSTKTTASGATCVGSGKPVAVGPRPLLGCCGLAVGAAELRSYCTILWVARTAIIGYVLVSLADKGSFAPVVLALLIAVLWLCYSRLLKPLRERLEQGIEVIAAMADLVTFGCALALLIIPTGSVEYNLIIGRLMIASQGGAIWLSIVTRPIGWWPTIRETIAPRLRLLLGGKAAPPRAAAGSQPAGTIVGVATGSGNGSMLSTHATAGSS